MRFVFLQCGNEACRLRFPATTEEARALVCPHCGGPLATAAESQANRSDILPAPDAGLHLVGLLDNIRSIHNTGSMFRSADGAGVSHLYLTGITATPEHPRLAKAALGAHETVAWNYYRNSLEAAADLWAGGYTLWALEPARGAATPLAAELPQKLALVVGNERAGVDPGLLAACDALVSLPMAGHKSSLNAAVAFGIAVYSLRFGRALWLSE